MTSNVLKFIAIVTMLIDHITVGLYWNLTNNGEYYTILRDIGRISFPIYYIASDILLITTAIGVSHSDNDFPLLSEVSVKNTNPATCISSSSSQSAILSRAFYSDLDEIYNLVLRYNKKFGIESIKTKDISIAFR